MNPLAGGVGYCEICKTWGHHIIAYPLLQKYQSMPRNLFCNFCKSVGHYEKYVPAFKLMRENPTHGYRIHEENESTKWVFLEYNNLWGFSQDVWGGFSRGREWGGFGRGGLGPIICYNWNWTRNLVKISQILAWHAHTAEHCTIWWNIVLNWKKNGRKEGAITKNRTYRW